MSTFYNNDSKILPGFSIELGKEWRKSERSYFSFGIEYLHRGARVENKYVYGEEWLTKLNADWQVAYLTFPIKYNYMFAGQKKIYFTAALAPCLAIIDKSKISIIFRDDPGDFPKENADYSPAYDKFIPAIENSTIDVRIGFGKKFDRFSIEWQTRIDLYGSVDTLSGILGVDAKYITSCFMLNYYY